MQNLILRPWRRLSGIAGGKWLYSVLLGRTVPYSATIRPRVVELEPGRAVIAMADRRRVSNHLRSIHAVALVNLAEIASGLAVNAGVPESGRAIVTHLEIDYLKKARGPLTATGTCDVPAIDRDRDVVVLSEVRDSAGDAVARAHVTWRVGPKERPA